jgi:hypothetical protein
MSTEALELLIELEDIVYDRVEEYHDIAVVILELEASLAAHKDNIPAELESIFIETVEAFDKVTGDLVDSLQKYFEAERTLCKSRNLNFHRLYKKITA